MPLNNRLLDFEEAVVAMALLGLLAAMPVRVEAQCILSGPPVSFEPHPPGATRPITLSSGFNGSLALYQPGGSGPYRLLMQESFGYSVLDLSTPTNPTALYYRDNRFPLGGSDSVTTAGDGQNDVFSLGVSDDGQRAVFSLGGPADSWYTIAGGPSGYGFLQRGSFTPRRAPSTLVQHIGSRYIAYEITPAVVVAADVTTLPATFAKQNMTSETTGWPGGSFGVLAGNYILYQSGGAVRVIDASHPGPIGNITATYPQTTITSADFGGRTIAYFSAAVDPADATKLWVLVELNAKAGENSPSYGLLYVTGLGSGSLAKNSSGLPIWRVPSQAGESWGNVGVSSAFVPNNGELFVLMWAKSLQPTTRFLLYSTTTGAWAGGVLPSSPFPVSGTGFALPSRMAGFGVAGTPSVYAYVPTTVSAYVIPMSCVSINAPAVAFMNVVNQAGAALNNNDTVFLGDQITITPAIIPSPTNQPLTGYGWNFDFDFHAGAASEDNGTSPRIRAPDNGALGNPSSPPALITVVGPCDPQVGGTNPGSGAGCWTSVTTNGAFAGGTPDFTASPATGSTKALSFAFEANNVLGSAGARLFTLNWKAPAAKLQSTQVLSGQPLVSGSEGYPTATGFKWYFGASPAALTRAGCTGATCVPTLDTRGTYYYWLTASYANGYVTPDYASTAAMGTYTVTDFAPAFTVNGSASGPVTAVTNQSVTVVNSSQRGAAISATYQYSLCLTPCSDSYQVWSAMLDAPPSGSPPTSATIPIPATEGSYALKLKVNYTGGTVFWPDPSGAAYFPLSAASPLVVAASVNPTSATVGQPVTFSCSATGGLAPYSYEWRSPISFVVGNQQTYQTTSSVAGNVQAYCFVADSEQTPATSSASATATFISATPVSVNVSVDPNPATVNQTVTFSCNATGGLAPYSYEWRSPISFVVGTQQTYRTTSSVAGDVQAYCFVTDSQPTPATNSASATATFTGGPYSFFVLNPCRVLDTRNVAGPLGGPALQPAGTPDRVFEVASFCGIPADARAISVNVTATNALAAGVVAIYRGDGQPTGTNTVASVAGQARANDAILQLALDGSGTIKVQNTSPGTLDLIIDVNGFFR